MEIEKSDFDCIQEKFIDLLSDGYSFDEVVAVMCTPEFCQTPESLKSMYCNADILREVVERGSRKLGQVWGSMWKNIKLQAATGSIPHAKLLIDYVQNGKTVPFSKLRVAFDD